MVAASRTLVGLALIAVSAAAPAGAQRAADDRALASAIATTFEDSAARRAIDAASAALDARAALAGTVIDPVTAQRVAEARLRLERARAALDAMNAAPAEPGARALAALRVAGMLQASALGADPVAYASPTAAHTAPSEALVELLARNGRTATAAERAGLRALDELPAPIAFALTRTVDAYLDLDSATRVAYRNADPDAIARLAAEVPVPRVAVTRPEGPVSADMLVEGGAPEATVASPSAAFAAAGIDLSRVHVAREQLVASASVLGAMLAGGPVPGAPALPYNNVQREMAPYFSIDLRNQDNTYTQDFLLLIDNGGDDLYRNNAGGTNMTQCACAPPAVVTAAAIDWSGNDWYNAPGGRACGTNGGACGRGSGFLMDARGNDIYAALSRGSNGGGTDGGAGFLLDESGDDLYQAGGGGVNGGGYAAGSGMFLDTGGDNSILGGTFGANGGGSNGGVGVMLLAGDDDTVVGDSGGVNGGAWNGGAGALVDASGNDVFEATNGGTNGGGALAGAGLLADAGGNDTYTRLRVRELDEFGGVRAGADVRDAGHFGVNGGGALAAGSGLLLDLAGADVYSAGDFGTNGGGGQGVGLLVDDAEGNDAFRAGKIATNGGAWGNAGWFDGAARSGAGMLVDGGGHDTYTARPDPDGAGFGLNGGAGLHAAGLIADAGGNDSYLARDGATLAFYGVNGGAVAAARGLVVDYAGDDRYEAGGYGANGADFQGNVCCLNVGAAALLFDGGGNDLYADLDGGSGTNRTVSPKGNAGAQVDMVPQFELVPPDPPTLP